MSSKDPRIRRLNFMDEPAEHRCPEMQSKTWSLGRGVTCGEDLHGVPRETKNGGV